jgi:hypothetical protein
MLISSIHKNKKIRDFSLQYHGRIGGHLDGPNRLQELNQLAMEPSTLHEQDRLASNHANQIHRRHTCESATARHQTP